MDFPSSLLRDLGKPKRACRASAKGQDNCCCDSDTEHQHLVLRLQDRNSLSRKAHMRALLRVPTDDADCAVPYLGCSCGVVSADLAKADAQANRSDNLA